MSTISNSTISNSTFDYNITGLSISNATIERCLFQGVINGATITGNLTKCQFEGLSSNIAITGPLTDMIILSDLTPNSALYVLDANSITSFVQIASLSIDTTTVPRLTELGHKECSIATYDSGNKIVFIVKLSSDDTTPRGVILMWSGSVNDIPEGYVICDGNNGTPNLVDRFIKATTGNTGPVDNTDTEVENNVRTNRIKLSTNHLPKHTHSLSGVTIGTAPTDDVTVSSGTTIGYTAGSESATLTNVSVGSENHSHNISSGAVTGDGDFPNSSFNIEPQAYALIFIMKL